MYYYEVLVATQAYHGSEALTYSSEIGLDIGTLVKVNLRARPVLGIVLRAVAKPDFAVKPVTAAAPFPPLPAAQLELLRWLYAYYPAPLGAVVRLFVPPTEIFPKKLEDATATPSEMSITTGNLPPLSPDQQNAVQTIAGPGTFLLHGITGSGKSRVYIELAARALADSKSALVLTPEIGLTAQLTETFRHVFGNAVYVLHSRLTAAERRDIYYKLLERRQPSIVIGPRSALFSPLRSLGLIVLDEAHDGAYKNESAPHYQAGRVAAKLAGLHDATLVLGSATPAVEDYYLAAAKNRPVVAMHELAQQTDAAVTFQMVDMRRRELFSRGPLLSNALLTHIAAAMRRGEQSLVFLNRRGTANVVLCSNCGWQSLCPNCDLALTYHGDSHELRCHVCGFLGQLPTTCPVCDCAQILFKSAGTKSVVEALSKQFPAARIQRFDTDVKKAERLEQHLPDLAAGSTDIIVGTQMVGKGLDLPKLSVVGIVNADSSLLIPDYTAAERTYQLLAQVVGRVGRGHRAGTVVVQTYDPENITLQSAIHHHWQEFYDAELRERKAYKFPPFVYLLKLRVLRATSKSAEKAANELADVLTKQYPAVTVDGPAPSFHPRERGRYSWQLLIKSPSRTALVDIIHGLPSGWSYDIDPINLL
ncbi:MAG TPA: primosomal protein N' [Candidatus Saccharimonadales bacterium]|jgi:primosomal protein N' (replication factor Y)